MKTNNARPFDARSSRLCLRRQRSGVSRWIIAGGESGGARFMQSEWARRLRDHCAVNGIAFFVKEMNGKKPIPDDFIVKQFHAALREQPK